MHRLAWQCHTRPHMQATLEPQLKWQGPLGPMQKFQDKSSHVIKMTDKYLWRVYP